MSEKRTIEGLGLLAVVISLVFVGMEIRQNNKLARSAAYQTIGIATAEGLESLAHDRTLAEVLSTPVEDLDAASWLQTMTWWDSWLRRLETVLIQVEEGLLPDDALERLGYSIWKNMSHPHFICVWPMLREWAGQSVREYLELHSPPESEACPMPVVLP